MWAVSWLGRWAALSCLGICVESPWVKTVPATASRHPPTWRRKARVLVAVPNRSRGAAFWITTVKTDIEDRCPDGQCQPEP